MKRPVTQSGPQSGDPASSPPHKEKPKKVRERRAVYVRRHPGGRARTSARAIKRKQAQAEVLSARLQKESFAVIGERLGISPTTARRYCETAMDGILPIETRQAVLRAELASIDMMEAGITAAAMGGDLAAIDSVLKLKRARARYMQLYPEGSAGTVINNTNAIAGSFGEASRRAETSGIKVTFVSGGYEEREDGSEWRHGVQITPPRAALPVPVAPLELRGQVAPWQPKSDTACREPEAKPQPRPAKVTPFVEPSDKPYESAFAPRSKHWMR